MSERFDRHFFQRGMLTRVRPYPITFPRGIDFLTPISAQAITNGQQEIAYIEGRMSTTKILSKHDMKRAGLAMEEKVTASNRRKIRWPPEGPISVEDRITQREFYNKVLDVDPDMDLVVKQKIVVNDPIDHPNCDGLDYILTQMGSDKPLTRRDGYTGLMNPYRYIKAKLSGAASPTWHDKYSKLIRSVMQTYTIFGMIGDEVVASYGKLFQGDSYDEPSAATEILREISSDTWSQDLGFPTTIFSAKDETLYATVYLLDKAREYIGIRSDNIF